MYIEARVPIAHDHLPEHRVQLTIHLYYILWEGKWDGEERQEEFKHIWDRGEEGKAGKGGRDGREGWEGGGRGGNNCCLRRRGQTFFNYWSAQERNCSGIYVNC